MQPIMSKNGSRDNGQKSASLSPALHQVLAANLRRKVDDRGISTPELAQRAGFKLDELEAILRGEFAGSTAGDVEALAKALDLETTDLLERDV